MGEGAAGNVYEYAVHPPGYDKLDHGDCTYAVVMDNGAGAGAGGEGGGVRTRSDTVYSIPMESDLHYAAHTMPHAVGGGKGEPVYMETSQI